jgi:hypothetical protein
LIGPGKPGRDPGKPFHKKGSSVQLIDFEMSFFGIASREMERPGHGISFAVSGCQALGRFKHKEDKGCTGREKGK